MSDLGYYLDNPFWLAHYKYAMGAPNGGHYKRWVQGSPGGQEPMPLYSNEYSYTYMKGGAEHLNPYRGNIKHNLKGATLPIRAQVYQCTNQTLNPAGCQLAAVSQLYTTHESTPHPFNVSYHTGYSPYEVAIPPIFRP